MLKVVHGEDKVSVLVEDSIDYISEIILEGKSRVSFKNDNSLIIEERVQELAIRMEGKGVRLAKITNTLGQITFVNTKNVAALLNHSVYDKEETQVIFRSGAVIHAPSSVLELSALMSL